MKLVREKLRNWFSPRLLNIYFWLQKSALKKAVALRGLCTQVLDFEIRKLEPSFFQIGEVDSDDDLVEYVSRTLTQRPMIEGIEGSAHMRSELAAKLIEQARQNDDARASIATFFLAESLIASLVNDEVTKISRLDTAREFVPHVQALDVGGLYKVYAKTKKRYWMLRKELAERSAIKFDVTLSALVSLIGIASAILVISGYLYTTALLGAFDIDASIFFSLPDYLAASVEQIRHAGFLTGIGAVMLALGLRMRSLGPRRVTDARRRQQAIDGAAIAIVMIVVAASAILGAYKHSPSFGAIDVLGVAASYWLAEKISITFFKKPFPTLIFLMIFFVFLSHIGVTLYHKIYDLRAGNWSGSDSVKISLKSPLPVAERTLVVITANSNFVFALGKENKSIYVIPRDNIRLFEISSESMGSASQ